MSIDDHKLQSSPRPAARHVANECDGCGKHVVDAELRQCLRCGRMMCEQCSIYTYRSFQCHPPCGGL